MIAIDFNKRNAVTLGGGKDSWLAIAVDVTTNKLLLEEVVTSTSLEKLCGSLEALHDRPNFKPRFGVIDNVPPCFAGPAEGSQSKVIEKLKV